MADEAGTSGRPPTGEADDDTCARFVLGEFTADPHRPPDEEWPPGLLAGRYEVGRLIGSGGTARVYRAYDVRLGREVAVKIYGRDAVPLDQRRRLRETTIQASISHPGVVALLDSGSDDGRTFLVMQLVEGENLAERLLAGPMPPAEVIALADGLAEALAHVHARRIVHRDLKPANVFLSADGPLIGDFGIAHALDTTHITGTGLVPGTAAYLAPEQVGGEPAGPPADVYALGLILLECLTGEREYAGTMVEAAMARLTRPPRIPEDIPRSLAHTLRRMTRRHPIDRPTAEEVRRLLHAPAPTAPLRRPRWRRRLAAVSPAEGAARRVGHVADGGPADAGAVRRSAGAGSAAGAADRHLAAAPSADATQAATGSAAGAARSDLATADATAMRRSAGAGSAAGAAHSLLAAEPPSSASASHHTTDSAAGLAQPNRLATGARAASNTARSRRAAGTNPAAHPVVDPRPVRRRRMAAAALLAAAAVAVLSATLLNRDETGTTTPAQPPASISPASPSPTVDNGGDNGVDNGGDNRVDNGLDGKLAGKATPDPKPPSVTSPSLEPAAVTHESAAPPAKPGKIGKGETKIKGKGAGRDT